MAHKITKKDILIVAGIVVVILVLGSGLKGWGTTNSSVIGATIVDDPSGAKLKSVDSSGVASWFELQEGDIVTAINNQTVEDSKSFIKLMSNINKNSSVSIQVLRSGEVITVGRGTGSGYGVNSLLQKQMPKNT